MTQATASRFAQDAQFFLSHCDPWSDWIIYVIYCFILLSFYYFIYLLHTLMMIELSFFHSEVNVIDVNNQ